ncbi:MAG: TetR family transcriptional regulator C-terminal domain-containing protein, partial [Desulfitobacteriaceae bacterium]|nr:TetR family transcriptional regulator C-terminal domain-containing protein [Desulfitobacteriaceae bacterium]
AEIKKQLEQGTSSREKVWLVIQFFEEKMKQDPAWFKVLFDFITLGIQDKAFRPHLQRLFKEASEILSGHIAHLSPLQGGARQHSPAVLARILLASVYGILLQALIEPCDDAILLEALNGLKAVFA